MLNYGPMTPHDGYGCGRPVNWHYIALKIAIKTDEKCDHLDLFKVLITMSPLCNEIITGIKFDVTCGVCSKKMEDTSIKLSKKFLKFYSK